jgi:hypothetical protein
MGAPLHRVVGGGKTILAACSTGGGQTLRERAAQSTASQQELRGLPAGAAHEVRLNDYHKG